jgi:hypothetical protein
MLVLLQSTFYSLNCRIIFISPNFVGNTFDFSCNTTKALARSILGYGVLT